ncbi:MAG: hypothetical protein ACLVAW_12935 [Eisenbergiella massiliensis]
MKSIYISGNAPLYGEVTIQGSKNAALPIMAAALLIPGISVLKNCPRIADVEYGVPAAPKHRLLWNGIKMRYASMRR